MILFSRNIATRRQARALVAALQRARPKGDPPLLVMLDQEGGLVKRLSGAPSLSPAALGRTRSTPRARREGLATARNVRSIGVNVDLAPVVDVARRGTIMQRQLRSYGSDPRLVSRLATAFAEGLRQGGVLATAKHFPGLGLARGNEDLSVNAIRAPLQTLRRVDEAPYAALAAAGLPLVMVSSGLYPALASRPAELSHRIATTELRRTGFAGISISDDLEAPAMARYGSPGALALSAAHAGIDLLLYGQTERAGLSAERGLETALRAHRLSRAGAEDAARRVGALRAALPRP